jgi:Tfp pilus assembly ATPase PilU
MRNADSKNELRLRIKLESKREGPIAENDKLSLQDDQADKRTMRF